MVKIKAKRAAALLLAASMAFSLAACGKDDVKDTVDGPDQVTSTDAPEAPSGFVDNGADIGDYKPEELVMADEEVGSVIGHMDEQVYFEGAGFNCMFATSALLTDQSDGADAQGLPLCRFWDRIGKVNLGGMSYDITDLVRPRGEGFAVLEKLAADFGIDKYDPATGEVQCLGKGLSGDELREAYSDREDAEDYTVCVYYLHAQMSGLDGDEYKKAAEAAGGAGHDERLDGQLAVMLYYSTGGEDIHYAVFAAAPEYFANAEDYASNAGSGVRHDITNCHMEIDGRPVGFVNNVFLVCNQDTVPDHTIPVHAADSSDGADSEGRIEEGDGGLSAGDVEIEDINADTDPEE